MTDWQATMRRDYLEISSPELEEERGRVFGLCGGKCGEASCMTWNRVNNEELARQRRRREQNSH